MTLNEATILLIFANSMDARVNCSDEAASAWSNVLPESLGLEEAMNFVRQHYLTEEKAVLPAHIVGLHRIARRSEIEVAPKPEPTHDCMDGFVLVEEERGGRTITAAARCQICTSSPRR